MKAQHLEISDFMPHPTLVNAVGGGDTGIDFRLSELNELISGSEVRYDPEHWPALYFQLNSDLPPVFVFNTGKYNIAGADTVDDLLNTNAEFLSVLSDLGYSPDENFQIRNLVHTGEYPRELELGMLSTGLGLEATEYHPEKSSSVVYSPTEFDGTFLIFRTGKIIYTGSNNDRDISRAFDYLFKKIDGLFSNEN